MKPSQWRRSKAGPFLRHLPRLKNLRGTWLHRRLGERFFGHEMWQPQRERFAAGAAVGMFFAMMPLPLQMVAAAFIAFLTRVSIPAAVVFTWISNPFTIAVFLYAQFTIGCFLLGKAGMAAPQGGVLEMLAGAPLPILLGALVTGVVAALLAYPLALLAWDVVVSRFLQPHRSSRNLPPP